MVGNLLDDDFWFGVEEGMAPKKDKNEEVIAYSVKIPTFEIDHWHSESLLKAMQVENNHIVLKVKIELPHSLGNRDKVQVDLWYASIFDLDPVLLQNFDNYAH